MRTVCVFCGSSPGSRPVYREVAEAFGRALAARGIELVYGGGRVGLMGALADAALASGGRVVGVIPEALLAREAGHEGLSELHVVASMHERKAKMADLSQAFVALPGGYGTFEEFCEVLTWSQLGIHPKPCGLLDVAGYYAPLLALFDRAVLEGFVTPANRELVLAETDPERMLDRLASARFVAGEGWISRSQT
jgi:uncharacterized protein (TIGR00730 family)